MEWQLLGETLMTELNLAPGEIEARPLTGGDINRAFRLRLGSEVLFVKTNRADLLPMFQAERLGLEASRS